MLLRSILGGLALIFSNKMYKQLDIGWMFSLLAIVGLAVATMPWVAYRYDEVWRKIERLGEDDARLEERGRHRDGNSKGAGTWSKLTTIGGKYGV
jgi:hypothetical protein